VFREERKLGMECHWPSEWVETVSMLALAYRTTSQTRSSFDSVRIRREPAEFVLASAEPCFEPGEIEHA